MLEFVLVFLAGALITAGLARLVRAGLGALLEPQGQRLDRWRRVWFHPEREAAFLAESLLILSFVRGIVGRYHLPVWVTPALFTLWALHLPADAWSWFHLRRRPEDTRRLHLRGFLLLDLGPLWLRTLLVPLTAGLYFLIPPLRSVFDRMMAVILASLHSWFS